MNRNSTGVSRAMQSEVLGIDVGGANLKAARWTENGHAIAASLNFPMWKEYQNLAQATQSLLAELSGQRLSDAHLAVTMTGELADCFDSRADGVRFIIEQLVKVVPAEQVHVYAVAGEWLGPGQAIDNPWSVAASNWHALGSWLGRWPKTRDFCQRGLVVDIGSTTVDIIPMDKGIVATDALTDRDRLERGQLVYTGLSRTPVCAIVPQLRLRDRVVPIMAELFATADDAWLVLGEISEDASDHASADGKPRTWYHAAARLARMVGEDRDRLSEADLLSLANQVIDAQAEQILRAIQLNVDFITNRTDYLIHSGHGLPLWHRVVRKMQTPAMECVLADWLSSEVARCGPAAAIAWLWNSPSTTNPT